MSGKHLPWPVEGEVHLWAVSLEDERKALAIGEACLSPHERLRADAFRFARDREDFIARRAWLRGLLAAYLDVEPGSLSFESGAVGKPQLRRGDAGRLDFNMSHSNGVVACAVAANREVGVDIEWIREDFDFEPVARRYFTADERAALATRPLAERAREFFLCWTRKEACLKADGVGVAALPNARESNCWVQHFDAGSEYAAAVAVQGTDPVKLVTHPRPTLTPAVREE